MISNPEVNRTLATLRKAEFGFLGVIVEKLTDKSPLLSLYRTVHEIFTSYGSSFNSFEVIGSFSSFENLLPYSTPSRRVTKTNSVTFSCSNWTLSIYDQRGRLFFLPNICGSNHDLIIRTRNLSRSIPLPLIFRESERSFSSLNLFIWNLGSSIFYLFWISTYFFFALFFISFRFSFPLFSFYSLPSFLKFPWVCWSCRIWPIFSSSEGYEINQIDFSIKNKKVLCEIFGFFLFLYPYPSVWINREPFLLYESILLHSNSFPIPPKENPELDPKFTG